MPVKSHIIEKYNKTENYAEIHEATSSKIDFRGVYPAMENYQPEAFMDISIESIYMYAKTSRTQYTNISMNKDQVTALRDHLSSIIEDENWNKK